MRKDCRPYAFKKAYLKFQKFYANHFIKPQLDFLGSGFLFMRPWNIEIFGSPIKIHEFSTVIATPDKKIRLSVWPIKSGLGSINIGRYCILCPGVRISSACAVDIADNCMIANNVYITDCDWHGIYDRISFGKAIPVNLEDNVWVGDSAIICKGVTVGHNSIIGAGSVVVESVPSNVIVAGNPAKVVKILDDTERITVRKDFFSNPKGLVDDFRKLDLTALRDNTFWSWIKSLLFPSSKN